MTWKERLSPSRVAAGLVVVAGLATAIATPFADIDWQDQTSVLGGLIAIAGIVYKWLDGRSKWEVAQVEATKPTNVIPIPTAPGPTQGSSAPTGDGDDTTIPEGDQGDSLSNIGPDGRPIEVAEVAYPEAA